MGYWSHLYQFLEQKHALFWWNCQELAENRWWFSLGAEKRRVPDSSPGGGARTPSDHCRVAIQQGTKPTNAQMLRPHDGEKGKSALQSLSVLGHEVGAGWDELLPGTDRCKAAAPCQSAWSTDPQQTRAPEAATLWSSLSWSQSSPWWPRRELNPPTAWTELLWAPEVIVQSPGSLSFVSALSASVSGSCRHCGPWQARRACAPAWGWTVEASSVDSSVFSGALQQQREYQFRRVWSICSPVQEGGKISKRLIFLIEGYI